EVAAEVTATDVATTFHGYTPEIQLLMIGKVGKKRVEFYPAGKRFLNKAKISEEKLPGVFYTLFAALDGQVHLALSDPQFVAWLATHRGPLVAVRPRGS